MQELRVSSNFEYFLGMVAELRLSRFRHLLLRELLGQQLGVGGCAADRVRRGGRRGRRDAAAAAAGRPAASAYAARPPDGPGFGRRRRRRPRCGHMLTARRLQAVLIHTPAKDTHRFSRHGEPVRFEINNESLNIG